MRAFELVHCYHAAGFPVLAPHVIASGLPELMQYLAALGISSVPMRTIRACHVCDLRWSLIEKNLNLRTVSVEFHHFYKVQMSAWCFTE